MTDPREALSSATIKQVHEFAQAVASKSIALVRDMYLQQRQVQIKSDSSLVTEIDVALESFIRAEIGRAFPEHGIIGEESLAPDYQGQEFTWVIDPIDGTQSLVNQIPTFGTMLALMHGDHVLVGVIAFPMLAEIYHAAYRRGSFVKKLDPQLRTQVSEARLRVDDLDLLDAQLKWRIPRNEILMSGSRMQCALSGHDRLFDYIVQHHPYLRIYHDCFGLVHAVSGRASAMLELNVSFWDIAPCRVMVEEAGGLYHAMECVVDKHGKTLHSAIFGKPSAVRYLAELAENLELLRV